MDLPVAQVLRGEQAAVLTIAAHDLRGDVATVKTLVCGIYGGLAVLAGIQGRSFRLDQFLQGGQQVRLPENLAVMRRCARPGIVLVQMRQEQAPRIGPVHDLLTMPLHAVSRGRLDRVAIGHLHGRRQHLGQAQAPELGQHHHQPARRARRHRRQRPVLRRVNHAPRPEIPGCRAGGCDAERVDAVHLAGIGVVDQRLGLAAPAQHVPHGGGGRQHGAGRVHRVAAPGEGHGAGGGAQRLAGHCHPVLAVQDRLGGALRQGGGSCKQGRQGEHGSDRRRPAALSQFGFSAGPGGQHPTCPPRPPGCPPVGG